MLLVDEHPDCAMRSQAEAHDAAMADGEHRSPHEDAAPPSATLIVEPPQAPCSTRNARTAAAMARDLVMRPNRGVAPPGRSDQAVRAELVVERPQADAEQARRLRLVAAGAGQRRRQRLLLGRPKLRRE